NDQTGDCFMFTNRLAELACELGVEFRFGCNIARLENVGERIARVWVDGELERADQYVLALGSYSPQMLKPLGIKAPTYPLVGYARAVPNPNADIATTSTLLDETDGAAMTRLGSRLRVGGRADIAGPDLALDPRPRATLERVGGDPYPHGGDPTTGEVWTGL